MNMKIKQIILALVVIGSPSVLAQMSDGNIEELTINASFEASKAEPVETMKGLHTFESEAGGDIMSRQEALPETINEVASGLQTKLDHRMEMDFEQRVAVHPTFAIAY